MSQKARRRKRSLSVNNNSLAGLYDNSSKKSSRNISPRTPNEKSNSKKNVITSQKKIYSSKLNSFIIKDEVWGKETELVLNILSPKPNSSRSNPTQTPRDKLLSPKSNSSSPRDLIMELERKERKEKRRSWKK